MKVYYTDQSQSLDNKGDDLRKSLRGDPMASVRLSHKKRARSARKTMKQVPKLQIPKLAETKIQLM
jgi:hypothetical protein